LAVQDVDLGAITAKLVDVMRADPAAENLTLNFTPYKRPVVISADPVRIEQVVLNLLSNAIKFTQSGGSVSVSLVIDGAEARLEVADTGAGISAEFLPRVFDMFGQGTATALRSKAGLGIGLAGAGQHLHAAAAVVAHEGRRGGRRFSHRLHHRSATAAGGRFGRYRRPVQGTAGE
jgi:two-component system CheB/CheR fusion protein